MSLIPFNKNKLAHRNLGNFIDDFFGDSWSSMATLMNTTFKLDVREEILHYTVEAEMPGAKKEDISIDFDDGRLTITLSQKEESEEDSTKYIHKERQVSSMQRSVYLAGAKAEGITAGLKDGVLCITVPKEEDTSKRAKIEIQ